MTFIDPAGEGKQDPGDKMIEVMERIAKDLERVLIGIVLSSAFLALISFLMVFRLMIGR